MTLFPQAPDWVANAALVALAAVLGLLVGLVVEVIVLSALRRAAKKTKATWDDALVNSLHPTLPVALAAASFGAAIQAILPAIDPAARPGAQAVVIAVAIFLPVYLVAQFGRAAIQARMQSRPRWQSLGSVLRPAMTVILYAVATLVFLGSLGIEITPVLAGLGIGGIAIALALQDSLSNLFSGMWIRTTRDLRPGHFIRIEDPGLEGIVASIGWRTTRVRTPANNLIVIPNATLSKTVVTNYTLPTPQTAASLSVQVSYESDPDHVGRILVEEALASGTDAPGLLREPAPTAHLAPGFGEWGLQFTLVFHVREISCAGAAQDAIRRRLVVRFQQEGIRLSYPGRGPAYVMAHGSTDETRWVDARKLVRPPRGPEGSSWKTHRIPRFQEALHQGVGRSVAHEESLDAIRFTEAVHAGLTLTPPFDDPCGLELPHMVVQRRAADGDDRIQIPMRRLAPIQEEERRVQGHGLPQQGKDRFVLCTDRLLAPEPALCAGETAQEPAIFGRRHQAVPLQGQQVVFCMVRSQARLPGDLANVEAREGFDDRVHPSARLQVQKVAALGHGEMHAEQGRQSRRRQLRRRMAT